MYDIWYDDSPGLSTCVPPTYPKSSEVVLENLLWRVKEIRPEGFVQQVYPQLSTLAHPPPTHLPVDVATLNVGQQMQTCKPVRSPLVDTSRDYVLVIIGKN